VCARTSALVYLLVHYLSLEGQGPTNVNRDEQPYVGIRTQATLGEWPRVNALLGALFKWLEDRQVRPAGPPSYRYRTVGDEREPFDVEVGVPVDPGSSRRTAGDQPNDPEGDGRAYRAPWNIPIGWDRRTTEGWVR